MRESSPDVNTDPVLGALYLLNRKTGDVISYIALDTERVTLGRERECDIRLYFGDVSKLHAEIVFDQDSGLVGLTCTFHELTDRPSSSCMATTASSSRQREGMGAS